MAREYKELGCRDTGVECDFVARAPTIEEVVMQCAAHASSAHGMKGFPQDWYIKMRKMTRTVEYEFGDPS